MRDERVRFAEVRSSTRLTLGFPYQGGTQLRIVLRQREQREPEVLILVDRGQLACLRDCTFSARFGTEEVMQWDAQAAESSPGDVIFVNRTEVFIEELLRARKVILEIDLYGYGLAQFTFNITGLKWR